MAENNNNNKSNDKGNKKKKKDYDIIRGKQENIKHFNFGDLSKNNNHSSKTNNFNKNLNKINKKTTNKRNYSDKIITNKVWQEIKKDDIKRYKNISEEEKDKFIKNIFGTDKHRPEICFACGKELIRTPYITLRDKDNNVNVHICPVCQHNKNICKNCGMIINSGSLYEKLCNYCKPLGVCDCCGEKISNKELANIIGVKGVFCKKCIENMDKCFSCGKPLNENFILLPDKRKICYACKNISLMSQESILSTYNIIIRLIHRLMGIKGGLNFKIRCVADIGEIDTEGKDFIKFFAEKGQIILKVAVGIREDYFAGFIISEYAKIIAPKLHSKFNEPKFKSEFIFWMKHLILREMNYYEEYLRLKNDK
ncbi:MAG: hypothetical protein ACOCV8_05355, partial [Spirochaetota bacterium]